ncbi:two pore domain potassium channel family protein [Ancylomarina salipaludis]|uniref:Two pore domain potassium channel family protein n=1 Tax=Ancylomarina salipaludis TaxID=2501299 RepID=A0A4Q1JK57_9BACT|nr:potassium channel family protein [Ancylomarina salipaludis]RXQ92242.1 two pore domain potassium channel family protein [Ancylomarina salipaludis]
MNNINKATKILFIILLCNITFSTHLFSQNKYKRKISITEWIEEMEKCKDKEYVLEDTEIFYDGSKDSLYSPLLPRFIKPSDKDKKREKTIFPPIRIINCKLPNNKTCQVRNIIFQNNITFVRCEGAGQLIFYNCTFKRGMDFLQSNLGTLQFSYCSILQRTVVIELQISVLSFSNCSLYTDHSIIQKRYGFEKENQSYQYLFRINQNEKKINAFTLYDCKILPTEVMPILYFKGGKYDVIQFQGIDFSNSIVDFTACSVKENLMVRNCKFKQPFGMYQFNFPKDNTSFNWNQIDSVGLGLYGNYAQAPYTHKTDTLISNVYNFNELNSSYRKFYSMYRTQGDMESANACYKQLKDMETVKYHHLYQLDRSTNTWFNWRFNQFLKYFSEYGTNPVQSLIISMWVILIFAGVYFFFYSDWDGINRAFLIKKHRTIMQYFSSEQRLEDFYTENYIEDFKTFSEYKNEMKESKVLVPLFIVLLGKPLYLFSVIKYKIVSFIYRRTEILQGRWIDLKSARKVFVGVTVVISVLIYLIYLGLIRALNSVTLSINSFSTLGFGAIPVKGASRYITIIEGFLGWFLLSIFSVSLISQMLQN